MENDHFATFKRQVAELLGMQNPEDLKDFCWEIIFDIVEGTNDYEFNFEHLRTSSDFLMAAVLLSKFHDKVVFVIEPTAYYSYQAVKIFKNWNINVPKLNICTINYFDSKNAEVVFHHGRKFDVKYGKHVRTIVQKFDNEEVPQDPRSLTSLIRPF